MIFKGGIVGNRGRKKAPVIISPQDKLQGLINSIKVTSDFIKKNKDFTIKDIDKGEKLIKNIEKLLQSKKKKLQKSNVEKSNVEMLKKVDASSFQRVMASKQRDEKIKDLLGKIQDKVIKNKVEKLFKDIEAKLPQKKKLENKKVKISKEKKKLEDKSPQELFKHYEKNFIAWDMLPNNEKVNLIKLFLNEGLCSELDESKVYMRFINNPKNKALKQIMEEKCEFLNY